MTQAQGLRTEIQLLRAVAVLGVVLNHLWPGRFHGGYLGVDLFFVVSGYLITAHLLRELDSTGRIALVRFWSRRARRLLPASLLVLLASVAATVAFLPATLWPDVMREIVAAGLYAQNWVLAHDAQDYFASSQSPSPVTHYWSLSLEEQFYLVWPVVALGAYATGRRLGRGRAVLFGALALVVAASLAYSVWLTAASPNAAYFVTPTRMWQLGVGGLLAFAPALARGRHVMALAGWVAVVGSLALFTEGAPVPGWVALVPVLGAAAVIWAGDAFLAGAPAMAGPCITAGVWVGGISYAVYLWHWPPVVVLPYVVGHPLDLLERLMLLGAILIVAWATTRFVEDPVRRWEWVTQGPARRTLLPAAAGMLAVVVATQLATRSIEDRRADVVAEVEGALASGDRCFAARAIANDCAQPHLLRYRDSPLLTVDTYQDEPAWGEACMQRPDEPEVVECEFGVPAEEATRRLALVGDSHARQWFPAIDELAVEHRWNVVIIAKPSCPVNASAIRTRNYPEFIPSCRSWNAEVVRRVADDPAIEVVLTSAYSRNYVVEGFPVAPDQSSGPAGRAEMAQGYREVWEQWTASGKEVVVLGDTPRMRLDDIPTCVAESGTYVDPCTAPQERVTRGDPLLRAARETRDPAVVPVDLTRFFCDGDRCHSVIGGVVAFSDSNHMIGFFSRSLAPYLYRAMAPALD